MVISAAFHFPRSFARDGKGALEGRDPMSANTLDHEPTVPTPLLTIEIATPVAGRRRRY